MEEDARIAAALGSDKQEAEAASNRGGGRQPGLVLDGLVAISCDVQGVNRWAQHRIEQPTHEFLAPGWPQRKKHA